jgi:hypothetical protein
VVPALDHGRTYYYTQESCGIAAGLLIAAIHRMGLVTLTHTPSPMGFLAELLDRPATSAMLVMLGLLATLVAACAMWRIVQRNPTVYLIALRRFILLTVALPLATLGIAIVFGALGGGHL